MQDYSQNSSQQNGSRFSQEPIFNTPSNPRTSVFIVVVLVFAITVGIGYWLGRSLVIRDSNAYIASSDSSGVNTEKQVLALLELDDLSVGQPTLISIWLIHLNPGDPPKLGFTPVAAYAMPDEPTYELLDKFELNEKRGPSAEFLKNLSKVSPQINGYMMVDQESIYSSLRWFLGKETAESVTIENHTMTEYGQALRSFCHSLATDEERPEFPWSMVNSGHYVTSLSFHQTFQNLDFLVSSPAPNCVMVPLP